ncbi:MAG: cupin domain-containing protein [Actinobacteria bacterium]|nr:MAG: cupin domain-containing protein [Actinomycetota bacterium]
MGGRLGGARDGVGRRAPAGRGGRPVIVDRPWGRLATYALNQPVTVRLVTVDPGARTGAHYHRLREEMWIVLDPGLTVEIGNRTVEAAVGEEITVPAHVTVDGRPHRPLYFTSAKSVTTFLMHRPQAGARSS